MVIRVTHGGIDPEWVRTLVAAVRPSPGPAPRRVVVFLSDWPLEGRARVVQRVVMAGIGKWAWFPYSRPPMSGGYSNVYLRSPTEALVYTLAHELRHLWQYTHPTPRLNGGRSGCLSEVDADAWAIRQLRHWRAHGPR